MTGAELLLLATICFLGMLAPGPDFILVARNAITQPRGQALATAFGIVVGCTVHATYCMLGLALVITKSILIYSAIRYLGAAYLVYIGVKALLAKKSYVEITVKSVPALTVRTAFMQGFLCNVLNPKLAVFLLSLFTQFIMPTAPLAQKAIVTSIFFGEALFYWPLLALALQLSAVRNTLQNVQGSIDKICGVILIALGLRVALSRS